MPLILEFHRHAVVAEPPKLLLELVVQLPRPFTLQEFDDFTAAIEEFGPVSPLGVLCVCGCYTLWVASVPEVFGNLYLAGCEYGIGKWWGDDGAHGWVLSLG
jgi:hypothetical protein